MQMNKIALATLIASGACAVQANTQLSPVTVTASPLSQQDAMTQPSQVDRLTHQQTFTHGTGSLGELLESIPGVNNMSSGSQAGKPVIRGQSGNRVKVLSNGKSTDYQAYGNRHNPNIEPYFAQNIEVVRGPQSVLYGSQAMGGVVNVIQAPIAYSQPLNGELSTEFNSNNQETLLGAKVGVGSKHFGMVAGMAKRQGDNYHTPKTASSQGNTPSNPSSDLPLFVGQVPYTNFANQAAYLGLGYQDHWGKVELRQTYWHSKQNLVGEEASSNTSPYQAVATGQKLLNNETQLSAEFYTQDWIIKPSWVHTRNQREAAHEVPYETMSSAKGSAEYLDLLVKRDDFKLALEHPSIGDFEGEIGLELSEKSQTLRSGDLTPSAHQSKRAVYAFEEAQYDKWLIQLGARYDAHQIKAPLTGNNAHFVDSGVFNASNNQRNFHVATGSIGATYQFNNQWSLAGNLAKGFRSPSIFELYAGGTHGGVQAYQLGNPNLTEETAFNTDLSLRWKTAKTKMVATVYQNLFNNYIYLANTGYYRAKEGAPNEGQRVSSTAPGAIVEMQAQQTDDAVIHGFELSLNHQWNSKWANAIALEIIKGTDQSNRRDLPLIPANNLLLSATYTPNNWKKLHKQQWQIESKLVAAKNSAGAYEPFSQYDQASIGTASTQAYALWNLRYSTQIALDKQHLKLGLSIQNILDTAYVDFLDTYKGYTLGRGRNLQLSASLAF